MKETSTLFETMFISFVSVYFISFFNILTYNNKKHTNQGWKVEQKP